MPVRRFDPCDGRIYWTSFFVSWAEECFPFELRNELGRQCTRGCNGTSLVARQREPGARHYLASDPIIEMNWHIVLPPLLY